jgi:hypothetical protein
VCRNPMLTDLRATLVNVARWRTTPRQKVPGKHGCVWRESGTSLQSTRGTAAEFLIATSSSANRPNAPRPSRCFGSHHQTLGQRG